MTYYKYKIVAMLCFASVLLNSCDSYLEEENKTAVSLDSANSNAETFNLLVASVYQRARETTTYYASEMMYTLEDLGTDIVTRGSALAGTDQINDYVNIDTQNSVFSTYWGNQYSIISAANLVIDDADLIDGLSEEDKIKGIGEAKFFRALSYFNLVENFGGVPLVLNVVNTASTDYYRATEEEVYTQIISDFEDAIATVDATPTEYGRVSKDAARHFLSKVLLTRGYKTFAASTDFADAASLAETVIANHDLVATFSELIDISNQRNSEVVFSYLFGSNQVSLGWGNTRHQLYKFDYFDYPGMTRGNHGIGPMPTPFFYGLFDEENDERAAATYRRVLEAEEDYTAIVNGQTVNRVVGDTAVYFPTTTWTDAEIAAVPYKVINPDTYFTNDGITTVHYPMFTKFDDPSAPFAYTDERAQGTRDMVMARSGEAYLIAAEAYFMDTNTTDAAARLTTLRSRAGLTTPVAPTDVDLDFILDERARELVGEVNRWMDLKRTSKLVERTLMYNPHAAMNNALTEVNRLRPIPQVEIDNTNGTITQNPL